MIKGDAADNLTIQIAFKNEEERTVRDKALYRLSLLGVVADYTIDYNSGQFEVIVSPRTDEEIIEHLRAYIKRYKTREVTDRLEAELSQKPGETVLGRSVYYLLEFVYEEIERKRRTAIQTMAEVAREATKAKDEAAKNTLIRQRLLAYLEESPFTEPLAQLAMRIEPHEWVKTLQSCDDETGAYLLQSVDGVRQLLGGCRRTLESYPEHPGLFFLSSLARLLLPDPEIELALNEAKQAFSLLSDQVDYNKSKTIELLFKTYSRWLKETVDYAEIKVKLADAALAACPQRSMAHTLYSIIPDQCTRLLVNLILQETRDLATRISDVPIPAISDT